MTTTINESGKATTLALQILNYTRDSLLVNLRFLDASLNVLPFKEYSGSLATDGKNLLFDARHICRLYKDEANAPTRGILHMIFHCVLGHIFIPENADIRLWNLACDIAVEYTITSLSLKLAACKNDARMARAFDRFSGKVDMLTAEKLYRYFLKTEPDDEFLSELEDLFRMDDHQLWISSDSKEHDLLKASWLEISHRMQIDMETFARKQGDKAFAVMQGLKEVNRETTDYEGFLKKYVTRSDGMKLNMDEFDYSLYSYGMQMSGGKVPLIEQVEYKDSMRIRDVVFAFYRGELLSLHKLKLFIINTWNILHSTESFYSKIRLHMLQMNPEGTITHVVITSYDQVLEYVDALEDIPTTGYDFRPYFNKVETLIREKAFKNLRGLIILTDHEGVFPANMPKFSGTFIFVNDDYSVPKVPAWAVRLVLQNDEL